MDESPNYQREPVTDSFNIEVSLQRPYFLRVARKYVRNCSGLDQEDILQDAVFSSWRCVLKYGMPESRENFKSLVLKGIRRAASGSMKYNSALKRKYAGRITNESVLADSRSNPLRQAMYGEIVSMVAGRIRKMAKKTPDVVEAWLMCVEGYSNEEIADVENKTPEAVCCALKRFRKKCLGSNLV